MKAITKKTEEGPVETVGLVLQLLGLFDKAATFVKGLFRKWFPGNCYKKADPEFFAIEGISQAYVTWEGLPKCQQKHFLKWYRNDKLKHPVYPDPENGVIAFPYRDYLAWFADWVSE